jgi:CheY-like chemotaxis protein/HPt (histidine-containing phosphotransfer) domain-containing protein
MLLEDYESSLAADLQKSQNFPKGLRFLVVEDNLLNQKLICKTILSWECSYEVANNGLQALEKTAQERFDVILMDIHMPELYGCETTLEIRKDEKNPNRNIPIIALTAAAMSDEKRRAQEAGMNGFLTKPISPKILQEHILRAIQELHPSGHFEAIQDLLAPNLENEIDLSYLLNLSNGDKAFVVEIMEAFLIETPSVLLSLQTLTENRDWVGCGKLVHKLKPNFAMLGMKKLEATIISIEGQLKNVVPDAMPLALLLAQLISKTHEIMPLLSREKDALTGVMR